MKKNSYLSLLSLSSLFLCTPPCAAQPSLLKALFVATALLAPAHEGTPSAWTRRETTENSFGAPEIGVKGYTLTGLSQASREDAKQQNLLVLGIWRIHSLQ